MIGDRSSQEGDIWREDIPGRRNSSCRGPEVGAYVRYLGNSRVASVLGVEASGRRVTRDEFREVVIGGI